MKKYFMIFAAVAFVGICSVSCKPKAVETETECVEVVDEATEVEADSTFTVDQAPAE